MKIVIYADLQKQYLEELVKQLPEDAEIIRKDQVSDDEIMQEINSAEILVGNPPADQLTDIPESLKFWQLENVGFEQYKDLEFKGKVANVGDMSASACAETIVAGILGFYRGIHIVVKNQLKSEWQGEAIENELSVLGEKNVIILGSGAIGEFVCKMLEAFGCNVQMTAKSDPDAEIHSYEELLSELPGVDLVVNTLPGNLDKYVGKEFFDALKDGALYANIGRGNTTDEDALINALKSGKLTGAVLDVTETEPLPKNSKLWAMPNVILTQHTGAAHKMRDRDKVAKFVENVGKFLNDEKIEDEIELSNGY
jgi:glyoxylate/hydroxypyruvate reductase A